MPVRSANVVHSVTKILYVELDRTLVGFVLAKAAERHQVAGIERSQ